MCFFLNPLGTEISLEKMSQMKLLTLAFDKHKLEIFYVLFFCIPFVLRNYTTSTVQLLGNMLQTKLPLLPFRVCQLTNLLRIS